MTKLAIASTSQRPGVLQPANDDPRLVINYKVLNVASSYNGYPFSSLEEIYHKVKDKTTILITLDLANRENFQ